MKNRLHKFEENFIGRGCSAPPPAPPVRPRVKSEKTSYQSYYHIIMHKLAVKITQCKEDPRSY